MAAISIYQDTQEFILNEDNNFVCAHINGYVQDSTDPENAMWVCEDCEMYSAAFIDGIDEWGHPEYKTPDTWEWQ